MIKLNLNLNNIDKLEEFLKERGKVSFLEIKDSFDDNPNDLIDKLLYLAVVKGQIVKEDVVGGNNTYTYLDPYYRKSSLTEHYNHLVIPKDNYKILLISDTHILGEVFNLNMIESIYEYAENNGVSLVMHFGDIFHKQLEENDILEAIETFKKYYPKNIDTYSILGNHDKPINDFYLNRVNDSFDLRGLEFFNKKFHVLPCNRFNTNIGNNNYHFSHKLYLNDLVDDMKIDSIEDIKEYKMFFSSNSKINISGHLHKPFIYSIDDFIYKDKKYYLGVPSLSSINKEDVCAFILDTKELKVEPLRYINGKIEKDTDIFLCDNKKVKNLNKKNINTMI